MSGTAYLIIDSSEANSDLYYRTGFFAPDTVIFFEHDSQRTLVLNDIEVERAKKQHVVEHIVSLDKCLKKLHANGISCPDAVDVVALVLKKREIKSLIVQRNFPVSYADKLRKLGFSLKIAKTHFLFPSRMKKTAQEVSFLKKALSVTAQAMNLAISIISSSQIQNGVLYLDGKPLTSEIVRSAVNSFLAGQGYLASNTIVAGGVLGSMPHETGSGPLLSGWPVVIDIFPKSQENGYFGDMTRTVVKGEPSKRLLAMYDTVLKGQKIAFSMIKDRVKSRDVHSAIMDFFEESGFRTSGSESGSPEGFIHSTGHGLGLDIHEPPRIGSGKEILREGNVVTVEPGLYYGEMGGVRIEDVVLVTKDGNEQLTQCSKKFRV